VRQHARFLLLAGLVVAVGFAAGAPALAKGKKKKAEEVKPVEPPKPVWPSPLDPGVFDSVFKEMPFGKERGPFLDALHVLFEEQLKPVLRATLDPRERDVLKGKMEKTFEDVKASYVEFGGQGTGYAVSVISGEFADSAGEALYKYVWSNNAAYFFFSANALWKLFICSQTEADYPGLLVKLATRYGDPVEIQYRDEEKTQPIRAVWRDTTFELVVEPPEGIFVCSRLRWEFLPARPAVEQARKAAAEKAQGDSGTDDILKDVQGDDTGNDPNVLDKIIENKKKKAKEQE